MSEERPPDGAPIQPEAPQDDSTAAIDGLRREAEENWNRYLRAVAELENLRKRSAREIEGARKFGAERLAQAILPVRDSIEAGIATAQNADPTTMLEGQRATLRLLDQALATVGVREIDPRCEPFDPTKHEALSLLPSADVEPNTVLEVIQKGYEIHDRLLRAAKVIVARE
jgi:molecular chaperone GrpE